MSAAGIGEHTIVLTRLGYDVLGIDYAPTAVEQARGTPQGRASTPASRWPTR